MPLDSLITVCHMLQRCKVRRKTHLQRNINTEQKSSTHQNCKNSKTREKILPKFAYAVRIHWACFESIFIECYFTKCCCVIWYKSATIFGSLPQFNPFFRVTLQSKPCQYCLLLLFHLFIQFSKFYNTA